jgi:hypothetical protein
VLQVPRALQKPIGRRAVVCLQVVPASHRVPGPEPPPVVVCYVHRLHPHPIIMTFWQPSAVSAKEVRWKMAIFEHHNGMLPKVSQQSAAKAQFE